MSIVTRITRFSPARAKATEARPAIPDWVTWDLNSIVNWKDGLRYKYEALWSDGAGRREAAIAEQVRKRGYNFSQLAREYGIPVSNICSGIRGRSRVGEEVLADFLGVPVEVLFPESWDPRSPFYEGKSGTRQARTWKAKRRKLLRRLRMWLCRRLRCAAS